MAGRRVCSSNKAVAVAMAVGALLALLFAAGEAGKTCKVDQSTVWNQCASCLSSGTPSKGCCNALRGADFGCLCHKYWDKLQDYGSSLPYAAKCVGAIPTECKLPNAKCKWNKSG